ncbi:MAG: NADH-quinone oxidoreductase subunit N [Candidatus Omnitrophica bacterium]|nr:NADH-quinone oxidoreductase subunit N [Candidatus Omnitrophota bacterium]
MSVLLSVKYFFPEIVLTGFAVAVLIVGLFVKRRAVLGMFCLLGILAAILLMPQSYQATSPLFSGMLINDSFSEFFKEIVFLVVGLVILVSMGYRAFSDEDAGEYYFLLLSVLVAMMIAASSNNLIMIYIAIEAVSLMSYILVGFLKTDRRSSEAGLKYFLFGALATGVMLYGISFIYGLFGTTDLAEISRVLAAGNVNIFASTIALLLIFAGLSFKCALVPFHMWVPDAYQGAPTPVTALISAGPKAIGFAILIRVFLKNFFPLFPGWSETVSVIAIITMTAGNILAINQENIKRLLGYSSIAQAGYILIGFVVGTALGIQGMMFYILAYVLMNIGAFGCVALISNRLGNDYIEDYSGLSKREPVLAFLLTVFLLSLAGIPPLAGFFGKFLVFAAAIESKYYILAIAGVINSVLAIYYYVKIIKFMYLAEPRAGMHVSVLPVPATPGTGAVKLALIIALIGIIVAGLFPGLFIGWISASLL